MCGRHKSVLTFVPRHATRSILEAASLQGLMSAEYAWVAAFEAIPKGTGNLAADLPIGLLGRMTEWEVGRVP